MEETSLPLCGQKLPETVKPILDTVRVCNRLALGVNVGIPYLTRETQLQYSQVKDGQKVEVLRQDCQARRNYAGNKKNAHNWVKCIIFRRLKSERQINLRSP